MHKTVVKLAIKHRLNVGRDHNGHYIIRNLQTLGIETMSFQPTAQSGCAMIRRYLRSH